MMVVTITGPSGAGKDTVARMLSEMTGYKELCSYTTRPRRKGEVNGREHWFVNECTVRPEFRLAYTQYGGYEYWTSLAQIVHPSIYVIDEKALKEMRENFPHLKVVSIYVDASKKVRLSRGVSEERMARDKDRGQIPMEQYDFIFRNEFESKIDLYMQVYFQLVKPLKLIYDEK